MQKMSKLLSIIAIVSILGTLVFSASALFWVDGGRKSTRYTTSIPSEKGKSLVYRIWQPVSLTEAEEKGNLVVVLFHGFSATQSMMYPLMRLLTARGYWVITGDFRGHGESGGIYYQKDSDRLEDFDLIINNAKQQNGYPTLNWSHITIVGHSMGGQAVVYIGTQRNDVFLTIGVAPAEFGSIANASRPGNFAVVSGSKDQFFTPDSLLSQYQSIVPGGEIGTVYGDPKQGNVKLLSIIPNARHENEMADNGCLGMILGFIEYNYGFQTTAEPILVNINDQTTLVMIAVLCAILATFSFGLILNQKTNINNQESEIESLKKIQKTFFGNEFDLNFINPHKIRKYYWIFYIPGALFAAVLFAILIGLIPAGFASTQIMLVAIPGCTSLLVLIKLIQNYSKVQPKENKIKVRKLFSPFTKQLIKDTLKHSTWQKIGSGIILFAITTVLLNLAIANYYIALFPLNNRIFYGILIFVVNFILWLPQIWILFAQLQDQISNYGKAIGEILFMKFGVLIGMGLLALITGSMVITFILLFCLVEVIGTIMISITIKLNGNYLIGIIWAALTNTFVYLGYGVFMTNF